MLVSRARAGSRLIPIQSRSRQVLRSLRKMATSSSSSFSSSPNTSLPSSVSVSLSSELPSASAVSSVSSREEQYTLGDTATRGDFRIGFFANIDYDESELDGDWDEEYYCIPDEGFELRYEVCQSVDDDDNDDDVKASDVKNVWRNYYESTVESPDYDYDEMLDILEREGRPPATEISTNELWLREQVAEALKRHPLSDEECERYGGFFKSGVSPPPSVAINALKLYYEHLRTFPDETAPFAKYLTQVTTEFYNSDGATFPTGGKTMKDHNLASAWISALDTAINEQQKALLKVNRSSKFNALMLLLPPGELAAATVYGMMSLFMKDGPTVPVIKAARHISKTIEDLVEQSLRKASSRKRLHDIFFNLESNGEGESQPTDVIAHYEKPMLVREAHRLLYKRTWGKGDGVRLAAKLLKMLVDVATVDLSQKPSSWDVAHEFRHGGKFVPAIGHIYIVKKLRRYGHLMLHPHAMHESLFSGSRKSRTIGGSEINIDSNTKLTPMIVPPRQWKQVRIPGTGKTAIQGGFAVMPSDFIRVRGGGDHMQVLENSHAPTVYEAMNALGRVPWQINSFSVGVVNKIMESGGGWIGVPKMKAGYDHQTFGSENWVDIARCQYVDESMANYSVIATQMQKISLANRLSREKLLFFPHNCDFRGRAYPVVPLFNHLGDDFTRGMLRFGNKKPLGKRGLKWLMIHCSNLIGYDKVGLDERSDYIEKKHLDDVIKSVENPMEHRWWAEADNPLQALATMEEIYHAIRSPDHTKYLSQVPIHQDGSCNGLQHYAALGRDREGAAQVNLSPAEKPADVYSRVLERVVVSMKEDLANNKAPKGVAHVLEDLIGHIDRKMVKQTVMTSVYGVTFIGARIQFHNRIKEAIDKGVLDANKYDKMTHFSAANYLSKLTLKSIGETFINAQGIMDWLSSVAHVVAQYGEPVSWTTPLGMPVLQPYRHNGTIQVMGELQHIVIGVYDSSMPVHQVKQRQAFPPNFVHSLDASHMIMTAMECHKNGLDFAAVHDSYWTHAGTVDEMNVHLREQFVKLHESPILENFYESLCAKIPGIRDDLPPIPDRGSFDIKNVQKSDYFFA